MTFRCCIGTSNHNRITVNQCLKQPTPCINRYGTWLWVIQCRPNKYVEISFTMYVVYKKTVGLLQLWSYWITKSWKVEGVTISILKMCEQWDNTNIYLISTKDNPTVPHLSQSRMVTTRWYLHDFMVFLMSRATEFFLVWW